MALFGKTLSEYIQFQKIFLILTAAVGVIRLGLSLAGAPTEVAVWFSMTVLLLSGCFYYAICVHTTGFGSFRHVLVLIAIQSLVANVIISVGIGITAATGVVNIFSIPEFSGSDDPNHWIHAMTHLVGGPTLFALLLWLPASVVMAVTKLIVKVPPPETAV